MNADRSSDADAEPAWAGTWRVLRYGGEEPDVPTYYRASRESWDVIKQNEDDRHIARHPILEIRGSTLVLKDEGASDEDAEEWTVAVSGDRVVVTADTGPHHGAVGIAERIESVDR
jgi:cation diffusion facilitator CzcD-associated flavoprotein CzcO